VNSRKHPSALYLVSRTSENSLSRECSSHLNTCPFDSDLATETGQLRVIRVNGKSLDETSTIITQGEDGVEYSTSVSKNIHNDEPGLAYFEDGTYTSGPMRLSKDLCETQQEFEFNIVAPGGAECARVLQTIFTKDSTAAQKFRLGKVVVSIEKWLGPERANGEVDVEEELKVLTEIATLSTEPAESSVGEWRSFNRLAIPASHIADKEDARDEGTGRFNFECEETSQRARILRKEDGDDILDAQHISLPGGITTGVVVSGNNLVISAGWSTARGVCKVVEREYERDGATALVEVRDSSRVFDRWVGGEM